MEVEKVSGRENDTNKQAESVKSKASLLFLQLSNGACTFSWAVTHKAPPGTV